MIGLIISATTAFLVTLVGTRIAIRILVAKAGLDGHDRG